jgi:VWFA-related protein
MHPNRAGQALALCLLATLLPGGAVLGQKPDLSAAAKAHAAAAAATAGKPAPPAKSSPAPGKGGGAAPGAVPAAEFFETEVVDVSVVNVDVYVTDKKGNRVTGLGKDDFEMFEDGKPVAITNFYAVLGGKPQGDAAVPPPAANPNLPAPPPGAAVPAPVPEDQRLRLVVYIDNFNIHPFNRNKVMRDLRNFLRDHVTREDRVMLVTYDRELHVRRPFTSDSNVIASALTELETVTGNAVHFDSDRRDVLDRIQQAQSYQEAENFVHLYAESLFNDLSFTIDAMKKTIDSLAGLPGRKAVLYVSDGVPMIAGQDIYYALSDKYPNNSGSLNESLEFDASRRFEELASSANANRVTFYTIDAGGLRTYASTTAENHGVGPGQSVYSDTVNSQNLQGPLQMLAERTGGKAVLNTNNVVPDLERIANDFQTFYSLGYSPTHLGDGRYHKITVKVKKKGLDVRHRTGYRDKSIESQMNDGTIAALDFPFESNPLSIGLDFGQQTRRDDGYFLLPIQVKIPIGRLVLVPREKVRTASVRFFVSAMDSDGNKSDVQQARIPIQVPEAELAAAKQKYYVYAVSLLMRGGDHRVAVGVRDDLASAASFVAKGVRVGG